MIPYDDSTLDLVRTALLITLKISAPILLAGMIVGLIISLVQAITSIQDQTLSTVPKVVVMVLAALVLLPWVVQRLLEYSSELLQIVP
jgi:flagellar biosynthetic protein FliQ